MTKKIAIIEDNLNIQNIYKFKLEYSGYKVKTANNGLEGLDLIKEFEPDLILLDLKMPVMGGVEMLAKLYQEFDEVKFKIFILTNISFDEVPAQIKILKFDKYLIKAHLTPNQLLQMVNEAMQ
jgi:CheY-like chemotaxis protein